MLPPPLLLPFFKQGGGIGYQILIKSGTFALKQDLQYPPGGGGGVFSRLLVSERKKSGLLVSENPKIGIWSGRRPEIFKDLSTQIQSKTLFLMENSIANAQNFLRASREK